MYLNLPSSVKQKHFVKNIISKTLGSMQDRSNSSIPTLRLKENSKDNGPTQLLNCQWNSSGIDDSQMLKYQSSEP